MARRKSGNQNKSPEQDLKSIDSKVSDLELKHSSLDSENESIDIPENLKVSDIKTVYHRVIRIEKSLSRSEEAHIKAKEDYQKRNKDLDETRKTIEEDKAHYKNQLKKLDEKLKEVNQLQVEGGFSSVIDHEILNQFKERRQEQEKLLTEQLAKLEDKHKEYLEEIQANRDEQLAYEKERAKKEAEEFNELLKEARLDIEKKKVELSTKENELAQKENSLKKKEKHLKYEQEEFDERKEKSQKDLKNSSDKKYQDFKDQINFLKQQNSQLTDELNVLKEERKLLGGHSMQRFVENKDRLEERLFELEEELRSNPKRGDAAELKRLKQNHLEWEGEKSELNAQLAELRSKYDRQVNLLAEQENLRMQKESLEQRLRLQKSAFDELKSDVEDLTKKADSKSTFISCSDMDVKYASESEELSTKPIGKEWLRKLRNAIASDQDAPLLYSEETLRAFVSGLSMSPLSILQGISGTGKTSLPKAVAKALGGACEIVEVQSGWKDRQDLIGYYNTFEKKYYEGKFLKCLYMAGTPEYKDQPFFIILDEMNLSHPEHYFADILSIIEEPDPSKRILSISDKVPDKPQLMQELRSGGFGLKIPENVWFIGTANHDETTLQFAPKTYDRANVMEMPKNREQFEPEQVNAEEVQRSFTKLQGGSTSATDEVEKGMSYINNRLFKTQCNELGLGWGNRLEKQIGLFVPTYLELGGSLAEAMDFIICSRILRGIKGRYDLTEPRLTAMKEHLENHFNNELGGSANSSISLIEEELSRFQS